MTIAEKLKPDEYRCAMCREVFLKERDEAEAVAEAEGFGFDIGECDVVCDDCWKKTPWGRE